MFEFLRSWFQKCLVSFVHQYSVGLRTDQAGRIETFIGVSPILELRSGAAPADCATAPSGTLLAQFALPADWLAAAAAGAVSKTGVWTGAGIAAGTIGHFRIYEGGSPSVCHMQGSVTATGGGGDMTVDNTNIAIAQVVTVTGFTITRGNA
jgi:hypothetical protein